MEKDFTPYSLRDELYLSALFCVVFALALLAELAVK
jgi:hypothetical protein